MHFVFFLAIYEINIDDIIKKTTSQKSLIHFPCSSTILETDFNRIYRCGKKFWRKKNNNHEKFIRDIILLYPCLKNIIFEYSGLIGDCFFCKCVISLDAQNHVCNKCFNRYKKCCKCGTFIYKNGKFILLKDNEICNEYCSYCLENWSYPSSPLYSSPSSYGECESCQSAPHWFMIDDFYRE